MQFKKWLYLVEKIEYNGKNYDTVMDLLKDLRNEPDTYLSFQMYPQLEIWAGQAKAYKTPVGVYAYPINYAYRMQEELPFATGQPYIVIFRSTGNIIKNNLTPEKQDYYLEELRKIVKRKYGEKREIDYWEKLQKLKKQGGVLKNGDFFEITSSFSKLSHANCAIPFCPSVT